MSSPEKLACALGDVQDDAQGCALELVREVAAPARKDFDRLVGSSDEIDSEYVHIQFLVVEWHRRDAPGAGSGSGPFTDDARTGPAMAHIGPRDCHYQGTIQSPSAASAVPPGSRKRTR